MLTVVFAVYAVWWYCTFSMRFTTRKVFWSSWCADLAILWLAAGAKDAGLPFGIHCLFAMCGAIAPVFVAQCLVSPFED